MKIQVGNIYHNHIFYQENLKSGGGYLKAMDKQRTKAVPGGSHYEKRGGDKRKRKPIFIISVLTSCRLNI